MFAIYSPLYFPHYVGGGERLVQMTAAGLRQAGVGVTVITHGKAYGRYRFDDVDVITVPHHQYGGHWTQTTPDRDLLDRALEEIEAAVVHTISVAGLDVVGAAAAARGARLGIAATEYGVACDRRTLVRGSGVPCPGRTSLEDCFGCRLEGLRKRDRVLGRLGKQMPASLNRIVVRAGRGLLGRSVGKQLDWWRQARFIDAVRISSLARLSLYVAPTQFTLEMTSAQLAPTTCTALLMHPLLDDLRTAERKRTPEDVLRVGFVGRPLPIKGLDVLIDAAGRMGASIPLELRIYCPINDHEESSYWRPLQARVAAMPGALWQWCGVLDVAGLRALHREIDVLVVPSVWPEWLGFVTLEAQGLGTPVILSDTPSQRDLATGDGRSSWFVPPGDAEALADCLCAVWQCKRRGDLTAPVLRAPSPREYAVELLRLYSATVTG